MWNMAMVMLIIGGALEVFRKGIEKRLGEVRIEGNKKAPFSIPTTQMCRGGCYSFP